MRPKPEEQALPARLFRWRGADGSSVVTYRLPFTYFTLDEDIEAHVRQVAAELPDADHGGGLPDVQMCFYGVGNHGGGPTRANLDSIRRLQTVDDVPELRFSTPDRFFEAVATGGWRLPEVEGDFQHH